MSPRPAIPESMNALLLSRFGGPEQLVPSVRPVPTPGPGEVLIRVAYCGICRHDLLTRSGAFAKTPLPVIPGHQIGGTVVSLGPDVTGVETGQRVSSLIRIGCGDCEQCRAGNEAYCETFRARFLGEDLDGGYAEFVKVPDHAVIPLPDGLPLETAAVASCTFGTAYHAIRTRGQAQPGETVVVTGASGGAGLHALELLRHFGCRCIAVTSSDEKSELLRQAGADEVIVSDNLVFADQVKALTGGRGCDLVIEVVGERTLDQSVRALRKGGRAVLAGNITGKKAQITPAHFILKEISLIGTRTCTKAELQEVYDLLVSGAVRVHVDRMLPLEKGSEAHALMEAGASRGRYVLAASAD